MVIYMKLIDELVAWNVRLKMDSLKLSQKDLAKKLEITHEHLNKVLNGKRSITKSSLLSKIAQELGLQEVEIFQDPMIKKAYEADLKVDQEHIKSLRRRNDLLEKEVEVSKERLKKIPPEVIEFWPKVRPHLRLACLAILTGEKQFVSSLSETLRADLQSLFQALGLARKDRV